MRTSASVLLLWALCAVPQVARAIDPLVDQAEWQERAFRNLRQLVVDERALDYLRDVEQRVRPPGAAPVRVAIFRHSDAFAFALPNGAVYVSAGLLARLQSESELATVIAREGALATASASTDSRRWTGSFYVLFGTLGKVPILPSLNAPSSIRGVPQEAERGADAFAIQRLAAAGYDPHAAPALYARLAEQAREVRARAPFVYADADQMKARATSLSALAATSPRPAAAPDRYAERLRSLILDTCDRAVRFGNPAVVVVGLATADRAGAYGAAGYRVLADAYRMRRAPGDTELARTAYERALTGTDPDPVAHLGLARLLADRGDAAAARAHYGRYLDLAPANEPERAMAAQERASLPGTE